MSACLDKSLLTRKSGTVLSDEQEKDYNEYGYKCYDRVHIPGDVPMKRSNIIEVNGNQIKIPDRLFGLLLWLVLELKKKEGGWVDRYTLASAGIVSDPEDFRTYSNLRQKLEGNLAKKNGQDFIQNDGSKRYRISTHPDFIRYERGKLIKHPDERVREIARKLPTQRRRKAEHQ